MNAKIKKIIATLMVIAMLAIPMGTTGMAASISAQTVQSESYSIVNDEGDPEGEPEGEPEGDPEEDPEEEGGFSITKIFNIIFQILWQVLGKLREYIGGII